MFVRFTGLPEIPYFDMPYRFYTPFGQTYPSWPLPPNIEQYYRSPEVFCSRRDEKTRCVPYNAAP